MISKPASMNYFVAKKKEDIWGWTRVVTDVSEAGFQTYLQYHCACLHGHQYVSF